MLALFDKDTPNGEKIAIAQAILRHPMPDNFPPGKPGGRHFEQVMY